MSFDRRFVLKASMTAAVSAYLARYEPVLAGQVTRRRHNVSGADGKAMLAKYAKAVSLMQDPKTFPPSDPRSWNFQWYTHWVPGPQSWAAAVVSKDDMIKKLFAGAPANDPHRRLAELMWDTCQRHSVNPADPNFFQELFFCVWHRWYLYYFEEIVRGVLGDDTFTLPYWDYLSGNVTNLSLPPEFLDTTSPLYRKDRNSWVNAGERIDKLNPGSLNLDAFKENVYISGGIGFCPALDGNPHGLVHSYIGTSTNMGQVPYAAQDPIFWVHHCNLDRLWESWNRLPGMNNPSWPNRAFSFADKRGNAVTPTAAGANRVANLKYEYDQYYVPSTPPAPPKLTLESTRVRVTRAFAKAPVALGNQVTTALETRGSRPAGQGPLESVVAAPSPARELYLVLGNITAPENTVATFNVLWGRVDAAANVEPQDPRFLGTLHFFGVTPDQHAGMAHEVIFNVTGKVQALGAKTEGAPLDVTFVRRGATLEGVVTVGQVALIEA